MKPITKLLFITGLLALSQTGSAADTAHGKRLQEQNCMSCHDNGVYTRPDRRVTSMEGLQKQVRRCELTLGLKWFEEDIDNVSGYLNEAFYKF
jgi:mono/diheme cytochrome c family protein